MLKTLHVKNFKGWKDTGNISLAPLTIFFGTNSSGKSSIGHFLMMLKQSASSSDRKTVFFSGNDLSAVDVGLPKDYVYKSRLSEGIEYSYHWDVPRVNTITNTVTKAKIDISSLSFESQVALNEKTENMEVKNMQYTVFPASGDAFSLTMSKSATQGSRAYSVSDKGYNLTRNLGRPWGFPSPYKFYGFPDEAVAYFQNADILSELNLQQELLFSNVFYLGPLRRKASRLYVWDGSQPDSVGPDGSSAVTAYLAATNDKTARYNFKWKSPTISFGEVVAKMLKKMGLVYDFKVERIAENRQEYDVKIKVKEYSEWADILDVGTGISQVLPVIIQLFYAPNNSIIIMEQPELHLHPSAQAGLADVIIDAIHSRKDGEPRKIQLIIESHSEHFLRRLQRRIAEGTLEQGEMRAYFANNESEPATLEHLDMDLMGQIRNWPKEFFGDIDGDIIAQTDIALIRRIKMKTKDELLS